jgi:hypothetical protein
MAGDAAADHPAGGPGRRRWGAGEWIAVLALITSIIGTVIGSFGGITGIRTEFFPPPDCDHHASFSPIQPTAATASSALASQGATTYVAANAIDGDLRTAWIPAGSDGGQGESISLQFAGTADLRLVCVVNGYARSNDLRERNAKIRDVLVTTDRGQASGTLQDQGGYQVLPLRPGRTSSLRLTITTFYSGVMSGGRQGYLDTALSEVSCYTR